MKSFLRANSVSIKSTRTFIIVESERETETEERPLQRERAPITFPDSASHPNILLNRLTLQQKLSFQEKFNLLNEKQQQFVFDELLSSPASVQVFLCEVSWQHISSISGLCHQANSVIKRRSTRGVDRRRDDER